MRVSLNTIKQYIDFELPPIDELVARINGQLGGVEEVVDLRAKYQDAKIVKVVECGKHPNADRLNVCNIDAGTGELIQVVCGAPNVHAGMFAVWLPPESIVPSTYGTGDEFKLGARELRGLMSNGMLASARELAIGDDHSGIVEIDIHERKPNGIEVQPGVSFAEAYGLDDTIIDIENKMFTHRPDLFGQLGVAREIAGILGHKFTSPEWYMDIPEFTAASALPLEAFNDTPEKVPRFMAVAIKDVTVKPSPLWLQIELMRLGSKAINNIVDITNYVMLLTAQPTHAYDYDKLRGHKLGARMAKSGEKITLLNHKTYDLSEDDIVIADGEGAVGLAGIMGGGESEVSNETRSIVLEVANFDMYAVRKSSMRHGIFTDALTRFNKGQSPQQNGRVLNLLIMSVRDVAGGEQASSVFDKSAVPSRNDTISVTRSFINERLGLELTGGEMKTLLSNVEVAVEGELDVTPPFWRTDIEQPEDIVEEVGRLYGFDKLPREMPTRSIKPATKNPSSELKRTIRELLACAGGNEVLTYSFVHERILKNAGQDLKNSYRLSNALSPDLQYYRQSLTPSLLGYVHSNIKAGYDEFALFELNKIHDRASGLSEENVPAEHDSVALVYASKKAKQGAPFYQAKTLLEFLAGRLNIKLAYEPLSGQSTSPVAVPFAAERSAIITDSSSGSYIGIIGEYARNVAKNFKLPEHAAGFELDTKALIGAVKDSSILYKQLSRYPNAERDISLRVEESISYLQVFRALSEAIGRSGLQASIRPVGIYQPEDADTKNMTFNLTLTSHEKTLTNDEINRLMADVADHLQSSVGAEVI